LIELRGDGFGGGLGDTGGGSGGGDTGGGSGGVNTRGGSGGGDTGGGFSGGDTGGGVGGGVGVGGGFLDAAVHTGGSAVHTGGQAVHTGGSAVHTGASAVHSGDSDAAGRCASLSLELEELLLWLKPVAMVAPTGDAALTTAAVAVAGSAQVNIGIHRQFIIQRAQERTRRGK